MKMVELSRAMKNYRLQVGGGESGRQTKPVEEKREVVEEGITTVRWGNGLNSDQRITW